MSSAHARPAYPLQYRRRPRPRQQPEHDVAPSPKRQRVANGDGGGHDDGDDGDNGDDGNDSDYDEQGQADAPTRPSSPAAPSPRTPSSRPKDLSQIFAPLPDILVSPSRSPGKSIAKRMLVRARTEPFIPSPTSPPAPALTPSASLPLVGPQPSSPPSSPSRPPYHPNVRTYSQARSFLVPLPASASRAILASKHPPLQDDDDGLRESYADLRTRWGVDSSEDDPHHVPGITNELMSLTELRSKGESRRLLDELGYLFEGLEQPGMSPSVKRSSAVEVVLKMCDPEFLRKAKAADFVGRAWDAMRLAGAGAGDKVLDSCLAYFVALVARNKHDMDGLARKVGFFDVMIPLLETGVDTDALLHLENLTAHRRIGLSKGEVASLKNLRDTISDKTDIFPPEVISSTRLLASFALCALTPSAVPLPHSLFRPLLATLLRELVLLDDSEPPNPVNLDLVHIEHCLRVLDAFLLAGESGLDDDGDHGGDCADRGGDGKESEGEALGKRLVELCVVAGVLEAEGERVELARQCIEGALRVLVNLSHSSHVWCTRLLPALPLLILYILPVSPLVIKEEDDDDELQLKPQHPLQHQHRDQYAHQRPANASDRQCLALGLLMNITFVKEDEVAVRVREIRIDPACPRDRDCARACTCPVRGLRMALECLVQLFAGGEEVRIKTESDIEPVPKPESAATADLTFFRAHLAALLCLLVRRSAPNLLVVRPCVGALVGIVRVFLGVWKGVGVGASAGVRGDGGSSVGVGVEGGEEQGDARMGEMLRRVEEGLRALGEGA